LVLAHHDALLSRSDELGIDEARLTHGLFEPLAEMLGLWSLYKGWVEKSYAVLFSDQYKEMRRLLGAPEDYNEDAFRLMLTSSNGVASPSSVIPSQKNNYLLDKAAAFISFKEKLQERFSQKGITASINLITYYPGLSLRRVRERESSEDVARRLSVRIISQSVDECYAALGIIHGLGRPVSLSSILHFRDQIASPQPNGYQAVHAAVTYRGFRADGGGSIIVECRIVTPAMLELNEHGVVAALLSGHSPGSPANGWWNQIPLLDRHLGKMMGCPDQSIREYLGRYNTGSVADILYVFTPRGEIVLLPQGSTPLDFAYRLHTEMGHHAIRVEVNGQPVPHGYPLRNGDIVRVHYDQDYAGPDISWLGLVATSSARINIRRKLAGRARAAHKGRAYIENALLKALDRFMRKKGYDLIVTNDRVESFLRERAQFYDCTDVNELYSRLYGNNHLAQLLVAQLISSELSPSVVAADGEPLSYLPHQVKICYACLPVPGDPIVGYDRLSKHARRKMAVHHASAQSCLQKASESNKVRLTWLSRASVDQRELLVLRIIGDDRQGLLRDVLEAIYRTEEAYLYKVEAQTYGDRHAEISLTVRTDTFTRFAEIQSLLGKVAGVREIVTAPPSPSQRVAFSVDPLHLQPPRQPSLPLPNPYTSEEVYQRDIFYNRQELLDSLIEWLRVPPPADPMILHGQRRVGKTSLVKYLIHEYLPPLRLVQPVFIDLQALTQFTSQNIAGFIVKRVFRDIRQSAPPREEGEEPIEWLGRALDEARTLHPRLLIIIDEFNVLIDLERSGNMDAVVYNNLRAVMNAQRSVNWLLVVQDTHFFDSDMWRGAGILFQRARIKAVEHLDRNWARRLILEPARKCGIVPQDEAFVIDEVLKLTAGSPFLIHLICRELVERARRQGRTVITDADIQAASDVVKHDGERYFFHFTQNLKGIRKIVMAAVIAVLGMEDVADETKVIKRMRAKAPEISAKTVRESIVGLSQEGLLSVQSEGKRRYISIPIGLFRAFLTDKMDLDKLVNEWRATISSRPRTMYTPEDK
jgi:(p)ppGpp synthase/HD superfamily hydrolase